jgi:hypothetical protein
VCTCDLNTGSDLQIMVLFVCFFCCFFWRKTLNLNLFGAIYLLSI